MYVCKLHGSNVQVTVTEESVDAFARRWPCFGTPSEIWFEFDRDGNLIDLEGDNDSQDPAGISALATEAQNRAAAALGLPDYFRR